MSSNKILRLREVRERTGLPTSSIYTLMTAGKFPRQVRIGVRSVGWPEDEIDNYVAARIAARDRQWQSVGDAAKRVVEKVSGKAG